MSLSLVEVEKGFKLVWGLERNLEERENERKYRSIYVCCLFISLY